MFDVHKGKPDWPIRFRGTKQPSQSNSSDCMEQNEPANRITVEQELQATGFRYFCACIQFKKQNFNELFIFSTQLIQ
jgi:hypothetical protein